MSSADTKTLIARYYAAFNAGDVDGMVACVADDIAHDTNQGSRRTGKKLFTEFCHHMSDCYKEELRDIVVMASDDGSRAAAEFVVHGTYLKGEEGLPTAKGQRYTLPAGTYFDIKDGKIARVTTYYNLTDWIAQVSV